MTQIMSQKKVLITGASRGIGASIANAFRKLGAYVIGTKTSLSSMDDNCDEWIIADFVEISQIYKCGDEILRISPDILINCAGINKIDKFLEIDPSVFLSIQQVNLFAPFIFCQKAIPSMKAKGWGRIVNISSIWGKVGKEYRAAYAASKFGLDGISLALAAEHSQDGILVNCVAPGFTDTQLTRQILGDSGINDLVASVPIKRMANPEEIASFVIWLASDKNTYITGQNIAIDGGFSRV